MLVSENCISKDNVSEIETFILTHTEALNYLKLKGVTSEFLYKCVSKPIYI